MRCTTIPCIVADERLVPVSRLRPTTKAIEYSDSEITNSIPGKLGKVAAR